MLVFSLPQGQYNGGQLAEEINAATGLSLSPVDVLLSPRRGEMWVDVSPDLVDDIQAVVDAYVYNPSGTIQQQEILQSIQASSNLRDAMAGLYGLSARDKAYALVGRAFAIADQAGAEIVQGIVDRDTAATYITSKSEWSNLSPEVKAWQADNLEALALLFQAVLVAVKSS
jgi:hypothetical protein